MHCKNWARTICQLPKMSGELKWSGKTSSELYLIATPDGDQKLCKYFQFIYTNYYGSYDGSYKPQAVDLAGYLMYMNQKGHHLGKRGVNM